MVRAHLIISGIVQGVYFRTTTEEVARSYGVRGWVKNNPDGTVEAVLEGDDYSVKEVIQWCHSGPPMAKVARVDVTWEKYKNEFDNFMALTRYTGY